MSTVDNNDTIKQNEKVFIEKKQQNDKQFAELCYKVLYATIEMHQNLIKYITQIKEQALDENNKRIYQEKEEARRQENLSSYNEATTKSLAKLLDKLPAELTDKIKSLLESIFKRIAEIYEAIQQIDLKITEAIDNIKTAKVALAQEMKKYFVVDNPAIAIRARSLAITLPQLFDSKSASDNDSLLNNLYLQFTNKFADNIDRIKMSEAIEEGRHYAKITITEYFKSQGGAITPEMEKQIDILANQFAMQLLRDIAKNQVMTNQVDIIFTNERKIEELNITKQKLDQQAMHLLSKITLIEQLASPTPKTTKEHTRIASSIVESLQDSLCYKPTAASELILVQFEKTEENIKQLREIREAAREEHKNAPASDHTSIKLTNSIDATQKIAAENQESLDNAFNFLNNDTVTPAQQTTAPTLK